jgi:hypothetical protein
MKCPTINQIKGLELSVFEVSVRAVNFPAQCSHVFGLEDKLLNKKSFFQSIAFDEKRTHNLCITDLKGGQHTSFRKVTYM